MRRWSPNRSNGSTTVGVPNARIRSPMDWEMVRAITGSSGRSSAAVIVTARLASSSLVSASTASHCGLASPATPRWPGLRASATRPGTSAW